MSNQPGILDRRNFLRRASSAALTLPLIGLGIAELAGCAKASGGSDFANNTSAGSWRASICTDKEPGEPLIVPERSTPPTAGRQWKE